MNAPLDRQQALQPDAISLDDKYTLERGRVFLTGTQALIRLPMMQRRRDQAACCWQWRVSRARPRRYCSPH